jgi:arabinogalactan endo-1,4-beta-galactosidase
MTRTIARFAAVALACAGFALAGCSDSSDDGPDVPDYGVTINAVPGLPSDFMMGADVSMLAQLEENGAAFSDEAGRDGDALRILHDHGVNWVRLRLWNQPVIAHAFDTPESGSVVTIQPGESAGGANDLARDIALAQRAKALGMKVLLDFHYSDWWADPGKQFMPQAWEAYTLDQTETAIHDFTRDAIAAMRDAGAQPDMVQIGNELNDGFLWPVGRISGPNGADGFARLLSAASAAVREVDPTIQVMVHLADGHNNALYRSVFSALVERDVDFDVIGFSFYPHWHNFNDRTRLPMNDLRYNLNDIAVYFDKPVVVVEAAYGYTLENFDAQRNAFGAPEEAKGGYRATVQGQATFLRDLVDTVNDVYGGRGRGVFYWAPEWIPVAGAGWKTNEGDNWENLALFDATGQALPSLNVFRAVRQDRPLVVATAVSVETVAVTTEIAVAPSLPTAVQVTFSDDSVQPEAVLWDEIAPEQYASAGTFTVSGTIPGIALPATAQVTVTAEINLLVNPGFETQTEEGWTVVDDSNAAGVSNQDVRSGSRSFHWFLDTPFVFSIEQTVTGLEAGKTYRFSFWAMGISGEQMRAETTCGGTPVLFTLTGWTSDPNAWLNPSIGGLDGSAGSCTVKVSTVVDDRSGDWGSLDDFKLTEE